ncbi:MAG TPA: sodium-dependent transporter [Cyclobacteriaceae bacterium]
MVELKTQYTSRFTTLLTMVGVAVGLGNVWRFPYMMGSYGGSAFLAVYLLFTILFAFPALMAEMTLGRMSGKGTIDAFRLVFGQKTGFIIGGFLLIVITISGSYYAVVVSNVVFTAAYSIIVGFGPANQATYGELLSNHWLQYSVTIVLIISCLYIMHKGLIKGIEWLSKIVMPLFVVSLLYMIFHALTLPDAGHQFKLFLQPDLSKLGSSEIFAALGQAFFSVGLGGTFVVVYSSYLKPNESIPRMALLTGLGDVGASLLVSLFLIPSILVFGLDMASGPGLIFDTFPKLFGTMPGGRIVGSLFLVTLSLVAFLSLIAAYQVPFVSIRNEKPNLNSKKLLLTIGLIQAILALPSSLNPSLVNYLDLILGSGMQVLGSVLCVLGLTWGLRKNSAMQEMFLLDKSNLAARNLGIFWIRWIIPLALVIVLISYIIETF